MNKLVPKERGAKVRLLSNDGSSLETSIRDPYGEPEVPPKEEAMKNEFKLLATTMLSLQRVIELMVLVDDLNKVQNIRRAVNSLYFKSV